MQPNEEGYRVIMRLGFGMALLHHQHGGGFVMWVTGTLRKNADCQLCAKPIEPGDRSAFYPQTNFARIAKHRVCLNCIDAAMVTDQDGFTLPSHVALTQMLYAAAADNACIRAARIAPYEGPTPEQFGWDAEDFGFWAHDEFGYLYCDTQERGWHWTDPRVCDEYEEHTRVLGPFKTYGEAHSVILKEMRGVEYVAPISPIAQPATVITEPGNSPTSPNGARYIKLTKGMWALVDAADFGWLAQWDWHYHPKEGARRCVRDEAGKKRTLSMHRLITGEPEGLEVRHRTAGILDNRRANLYLHKPKRRSRTSDVIGIMAAPREQLAPIESPTGAPPDTKPHPVTFETASTRRTGEAIANPKIEPISDTPAPPDGAKYIPLTRGESTTTEQVLRESPQVGAALDPTMPLGVLLLPRDVKLHSKPAKRRKRSPNPHRLTLRSNLVENEPPPANRPARIIPLREPRPYQDAIGDDWNFALCWPPDPSAISRKHIRRVQDGTRAHTDSLCGIIRAGRGANLSEKIDEESLGECCRECRAVYQRVHEEQMGAVTGTGEPLEQRARDAS